MSYVLMLSTMNTPSSGYEWLHRCLLLNRLMYHIDCLHMQLCFTTLISRCHADLQIRGKPKGHCTAAVEKLLKVVAACAAVHVRWPKGCQLLEDAQYCCSRTAIH